MSVKGSRDRSNPRIASIPINRRLDGMPSNKCRIEIWVEGEWLECEWHPRTEDSKAYDGYLGTARTISHPLQIGFHAWRQNDHEFRDYKILGANVESSHGGLEGNDNHEKSGPAVG